MFACAYSDLREKIESGSLFEQIGEARAGIV